MWDGDIGYWGLGASWFGGLAVRVCVWRRGGLCAHQLMRVCVRGTRNRHWGLGGVWGVGVGDAQRENATKVRALWSPAAVRLWWPERRKGERGRQGWAQGAGSREQGQQGTEKNEGNRNGMKCPIATAVLNPLTQNIFENEETPAPVLLQPRAPPTLSIGLRVNSHDKRKPIMDVHFLGEIRGSHGIDLPNLSCHFKVVRGTIAVLCMAPQAPWLGHRVVLTHVSLLWQTS